MRVDVHAHLFPAGYVERFEALGRPDRWAVRGLAAGLSDDELDARVADMDAAGIDVQVLSIFPELPDFPRRADAVAVARLANDLYADVVARRAGRFAAFATLPLPHLDAAVEEAERAMRELGFAGVAIGTSVSGLSPADASLASLWEHLDRLGAAVFLHPVGACPQLLDEIGMTWSVGSVVEDTIAAAALVAAGIPRLHPGVTIINSHAGGAMPLLLGRLDALAGLGGATPVERPSRTALRMYYDTVLHRDPAALRCAVDSLGVERLLFGSDYPVARGEGYKEGIAFLERQLGPAARGAVLGDNAARILALQAAASS